MLALGSFVLALRGQFNFNPLYSYSRSDVDLPLLMNLERLVGAHALYPSCPRAAYSAMSAANLTCQNCTTAHHITNHAAAHQVTLHEAKFVQADKTRKCTKHWRLAEFGKRSLT